MRELRRGPGIALRRRTVVAAGAGVLTIALVGGGAALAGVRESPGAYRTATAEEAAVEQTTAVVGTVSSAARADLAFQVAGTVGEVAVAVGDEVTAGQTLATLDPASLDEAVEEAEAALTEAEQALEADLASQTATTSTASTVQTAASVTTTAEGSGATLTLLPVVSTTVVAASAPVAGTVSSSAVTEAVAAVRSAQDALLAQHETASASLTVSGASLEASRTACQALLASPVGGADAEGAGDAGTTEDTDGGDGTEIPPAVEDAVPGLADCHAAVDQVLTDQAEVDAQQTALLDRAAELDGAVTDLEAALADLTEDPSVPEDDDTAAPPSDEEEPGAGDPPATSGEDGQGLGGAGSGTAPGAGVTAGGIPDGTTVPAEDDSAAGPSGAVGGTATAEVATAADILAAQAQVDLAGAELAVARAAASSGELTSPIAGTVAAVGLTEGAAVSADQEDAVVTVLGQDGHLVTVTIPLASIPSVEIDQAAAVSVATTEEILAGSVSSIGLLDVSTGATPAYTVQVLLEDTDEPLLEGSSAQVTITTGSSEAALTVPTSAVRVSGSTTTVQVLVDGVPEEVEIDRGSVGLERTEVISGLEAGDEVVLADLDAAVGAEATETEGGLSGLGTEVEVPSTQRWPGGGAPATAPDA